MKTTTPITDHQLRFRSFSLIRFEFATVVLSGNSAAVRQQANAQALGTGTNWTIYVAILLSLGLFIAFPLRLIDLGFLPPDDALRYAARAVNGYTPAGAQGAMVALDRDGAVKAMIGGRNYVDSIYNRATQAERSPGSGRFCGLRCNTSSSHSSVSPCCLPRSSPVFSSTEIPPRLSSSFP